MQVRRWSMLLGRRGRVLRLAAGVLLVLLMTYAIMRRVSRDDTYQPPAAVVSPSQLRQSPVNLAAFSAAMSGALRPTFDADRLGNFEPPARSAAAAAGPTLPGEGGRPYRLPAGRQNEAARAEASYGMNIAVSDEISLQRSVPDTRHPECPHWRYEGRLPSASVVLVFHNEGLSVLLRTVHTVIVRSPAHLLHEVLLVDDFSDKPDLGAKLERYIERFNGKVKLFRNSERQGLIRTRNRGAQLATGHVVVFLDAHCEVNIDWLPPLLAPISLDRSTITVPLIDGVDHETFEYRPVYHGASLFRGIFEWGMLYKENDVPAREMQQHQHRSEPYRSPTHAGGLFAIDREYFAAVGYYDPGLLVWGGENFELSFKVWQCGGSILWVPCSRVGHVYRGHMPYSFGKLAERVKGSPITINYKRVIETWFDDKYKEYFYTREPMARYLNHGNISEQLRFKQQHNCKSFQWFMDTVAYDVVDKFPELPPNLHWGELKNIGDGRCLDTMGRPAPTVMGVSGCHGYGNNQLLRLNAAGQLGVGERCVEPAGRRVNDDVRLVFCTLGSVDGPWRYDESSQTVQHSSSGLCLAVEAGSRRLQMLACDSRDAFKKWRWRQLSGAT